MPPKTTAPPDAPIPAPSFEAALAELEQLVATLESGELPLEQALKTFEHGVKLTRDCQSALSAAQQKVQVLLQRGDEVIVEDFVVENDAPLE